ncbi:hypothetical protein [Acinetobacter sp. 230853]|jgi:hypothetical protein|uniref:hypothetical protein n=1 Tax=Acinetobacter sp. 230853 TaxID=1310651 RepID=UPI0004530855|nr:hypothetical protein [Acinetobacter sp. 230853]EXB72671.1 hypothetical protein J550_1590 [Acinetobacter sp. 230853]
MADFDWITEDLGRIKNELRLARNTANCRKIYDCMNISPELMDTTDLTLAFRRAFGVFLDPSIISMKFNINTETMYILRDCIHKDFIEYEHTFELETYNLNIIKNINLDSEKKYRTLNTLLQININLIIDIITLINNTSELSFSNHYYKIEEKLYNLTPEFILFIEVFGNNYKSYEWYFTQFEAANQKENFNRITNDFKLIATDYENEIKNQIIEISIESFKNSHYCQNNKEINLKNDWEYVGYLASIKGIEVAVSDAENKVLESFQNLKESQKLLLHYYIYQIKYDGLSIDNIPADIKKYTDLDLCTYLGIIAKDICKQAYIEYSNQNASQEK